MTKSYIKDKVLRKRRLLHVKWARNFSRPIFPSGHQLITGAIFSKETSSWCLLLFLPLYPQKCVSERVPSNISKAFVILVLRFYLQRSDWNEISQTLTQMDGGITALLYKGRGHCGRGRGCGLLSLGVSGLLVPSLENKMIDRWSPQALRALSFLGILCLISLVAMFADP